MAVTALSPHEGRAQAGNPMVAGNIIRDFARITFYWPEKIDMSATTNGTKLVVKFDRDVNPNFGEILRSLYPYVVKAELTGNQRTIIFTMKQAYKIRSFITDSESGVDILGIYDENAPATAAAPASAPTPTPAPVAQPAPQVASAAPVLTPPQPREKPAAPAIAAVAPAKPAAAEPAPAPAPAVAVPAPEPEPQPTPAPQPIPAPVAEAPVVAQAVAIPEEAPAPPAVAPDAKPADAAPVVEVATTIMPPIVPSRIQPVTDLGAITGERVAVQLSMVEKEPNLRFDFKERVAAALWQRGRTVMVLFNKPVTLTGLEDAKKRSTSWLVDMRQLAGSDFTLVQMNLLTDVYIKPFKDREEGYGWQLQTSADPVRPANGIKAEITTSRGENYVFLPVTQTANAISLRDPSVGDTLSVVPVYASETGLFPPRSFVDFDLLSAMQGVVVSSKSDRLNVERLDNGVRISAEGGLYITEGISAEDAANAGMWDRRDQLFKPSLFPHNEWKTANTKAFREREAYLLNQIASATDNAARNDNRMQLAQLYLSQGMYNETNAVLNRIRRDDLDFYRNNKLAALEGAAYFLNYRMPEAALSLSSDTLDGNDEGDLLRKAVAATMGGTDPVPYLQNNSAYIRQYPPALRQRLAIIAANQAIQLNDYRSPTSIFESLEEDKLSGEVADYVDFLKAKVAGASGRAKEAETIWTRLAGKLDDRQFRARSEYSLVLLGLEEGTLQPEEAIKRLDALRIVWRGDDLERSLLMVLGQLHVNLGNYWDGMKAWEELLQYYPNSPDAMAAYKRLAETFRMLFLQDGAKKMDQVKALALFSEFQELTPLADDGNKMLQNLVDMMVGIDLLDQAAARLENQIQYRLKGEEKSRVGARLAIIRLLNREPAKALEALQNSREDNVPAGLSLERNRIAAQALIDLERTEQALTMIEGDYSTEGEFVRLEAYWAKEDWAYVIDIIELMLRNRPDLEAPFSEREGQRLLQLALAYIFMGEFDQLKYLRDAYSPLMANNPYKDEFLFLTQERIETNSSNFSEVIGNISAMQGFMDTYRDRLKQGNLSDAVGNTANDAPEAAAPANPQ